MLVVGLSALAVLVLLVALLPTLVSMGFLRGTLVSAVSGRVNGTVSVGELSLGWSGPIGVRDLVIDDAAGGTRVAASVTLEQGLWTLLTSGVSELDVRVSGSVRTRREADGSLSIARLAKEAPDAAPAAASATGAAASRGGSAGAAPGLPAGIRSLRVALEGLSLEVLDPDGTVFAAARGATGEVRAAAGGDAVVALKADTEYLGQKGSFDVNATFGGLFAADGTRRIEGTSANVSVRATDVGFAAGGLSMRIGQGTVTVTSANLAGPLAVKADVRAAIEGASPASVQADVAIDRLLTPEGSVALDLAAIHGRVVATTVPTAPFERFVRGMGLELARDVGPSVDLDASFADASGGDLSILLRSERVKAQVAGSIDPATRAATLRTVALDATLAPALLDRLAQVTVASPARLVLTARDVSVPAASADGSFPVDQLRFNAEMTLSLDGLRVPGGDGRVPLDVVALNLSAQAEPVADGVSVALDATSRAGGGERPIRAQGRVKRGGALGAHGSLRASSIPVALIAPFVPASAGIDVRRDLGDTVRTLEAELGAGDAPTWSVRLDTPTLAATLAGAVAADGAIRVASGGSISVARIDPALLGSFGVPVDGPMAADVTVRSLALPAPAAFDLAALGCDLDVAARGAGGGPVALRLGDGPDARVLTVSDLRVTVATERLGQDARTSVAVTADGVPIRADVRAQSLGSMSREAIERAALTVHVEAPAIARSTIVREVPAAADVLRQLSGGSYALTADYAGSMLAGKGTAAVRADAGDTVRLEADLSERALDVTADAAVTLTPALMAWAAGPSGPALRAPSRVGIKVERTSLARTVPWTFALPASAKARITAAPLAVGGIAGTATDLVVRGLDVEGEGSLSSPMRVAARVRAELAAGPSAETAVAIAPLAANAAWSQGAAGAQASWRADVTLDRISGDGLGVLLALEESVRREIGSVARVTARAESRDGGIAFDAESTLDRLRASLKGTYRGDALELADSRVSVNVPPVQVLSILNAPPKVEPGAKPADRAAPPWRECSAFAATADIKRLRLVGSAVGTMAAVIEATAEPLRLVPSDGEAVTVEGFALSVNAPGGEAPAQVRARASLAGGGSQRMPVTLDATVADWTDATGAVSTARLRIDGALRAERASTRVVGVLAGMGRELEEAVGPEISADATVQSVGAGTATGAVTVTSRYLTVRVPDVLMQDGFLRIPGAKPAVAEFVPSEPLRERILAPINPVFRDVRLADDRMPIRLTMDRLSYPLDGNRARLDADLRLTVGNVLLERNPDNDVLNLLQVFQAPQGRPVDGVINPLVVSVRAGQLAYKDFDIGIERQGDGWRTRLIFSGDIDLSKAPPYARRIAANYPLGSVARDVVGLLPNEDGGGSVASALNTMSLGLGDALQLQVSMRGPLGEVAGRPAKLDRTVKLVFDERAAKQGAGKAIEAVGGLIGDLIKKQKGGK